MAYYNTTIRIVVMLVIIFRLSSTMYRDDKEDSLNQKLLGEVEYGSSSAAPTDNEEELSRQELIKENNYFQALNRGGFASPQKHITQSDELETVRETLFNTIKELDCNYMYDMLVYLKLMAPENCTDDELYKKVDSACSNWAKHMLNARVNSGFPSREIPDIIWLFYFYTEKMKMFAMRGAKEEMNYLQGHIEIYFESQKIKCQSLWPECNEHVTFADELNSFGENVALEKTIEACTHLSTMAESKGNLNYDLDTSLYINNVTDDAVIMETLITSFGGLDGGPVLVDELKRSMNAAKSPSTTSLFDWIRSLKDVHYYFLRIVKTIMLRVWWASLENLRTMGNAQSAKQVETLLYRQHLNNFACLFQLDKDDHFTKLVQYKTEGALIKLVKHVLPSVPIAEKMSMIMSLLQHYDTAEGPDFFFFNYDYEILREVKCQTSTLVNIANGIGYPIDSIRSPIRESILCAEVFVEYLKKILNGVNFNILQSYTLIYTNFKNK